MKKLFFLFILTAAFTFANAQKLDDIRKDLANGKVNEAKEKIDKAMADPKNAANPIAWYYKAKVYTELASKDTEGTMPTAATEAYDALLKYQQLEPKNTMLLLEENRPFFQLYDYYYNQGVKHYNIRAYDKAFHDFQSALRIKDYGYSKQFTLGTFSFPALDTNLVLLAASSAALAKQEEEAVKYFSMLADAKLTGQEYDDIYPYLVDYHNRAGNKAKRDSYIAIGKELYPNDDYWIQVQLLDFADDEKALLSKYEELMQQNPNSYFIAFNYAVELYNSLYADEKTPADAKERNEKLTKALNNAIKLNATPEANLLMARAKWNEIYEIEDAIFAIKGTKPEDVKKKQALQADLAKKLDEVLPYAMTALEAYEAKTELKPNDSANLKVSADIIARYYNAKKQPEKAKPYQEKAKF